MLQRPLRTESIDGGTRWMLTAVDGQPVRRWDSRNQVFDHFYDALRRPIRMEMPIGFPVVDTGGPYPVNPPTPILQQTTYGDYPDMTGRYAKQMRNAIGQVIQVLDQSGTLSIEHYNLQGQPLDTTRAFAAAHLPAIDYAEPTDLETDTYTHHYQYDALGRVRQKQLPDQSRLAYQYLETGQLKAILRSPDATAAFTHEVSHLQYNPKGQRQTADHSNGTRTRYVYHDITYRLTRLETHRISNGSMLQDLNYQYDAVGNVVKTEDLAQPTKFYSNYAAEAKSEYIYDPLYRLVEAKGREHIGQNQQPTDNWDDHYLRVNHAAGNDMAWGAYTQKYSYDMVGNMLELKHTGENSYTRTYNYHLDHNRVESTAIGANTFAYGYDAHGNMNTMPHLTRCNWNVLDQLHETATQNVGSGDPVRTLYQYDSAGNRTRKVTFWDSDAGAEPKKKNERVYLDGYEVYKEYHHSGTLTKTVHSQQVADEQGRFLIVETEAGEDPRFRYQLINHLQSSQIETDENGAVISYEEYHPFGTTAYQASLTGLGPQTKRYRFCGKERDEESGLYYFGARYLASWLGRWISVDPKESERHWVNGYNYCQNDPVNRVDPKGEEDGDIGFKFSLSLTLGTKDQSRLSIASSIGYSISSGNSMTGFNLSANIYTGGPGTDQPKTGRQSLGGAFTLGLSQTYGQGKGISTDLNIFNSSTLSAISNKFQKSFTIGTNLTYNNATEFNRAAGFAGKLGGFTATLNEDFSFLPFKLPGGFGEQWGGIGLLASGKDEGETGGGFLGFTTQRGASIYAGTEIFTGKPTSYPKQGKPYVFQRPDQQRLNVGRSFLKAENFVSGLGGIRFDLSGEKQMWSQNIIHDFMGISRFRSTANESFQITKY